MKKTYIVGVLCILWGCLLYSNQIKEDFSSSKEEPNCTTRFAYNQFYSEDVFSALSASTSEILDDVRSQSKKKKKFLKRLFKELIITTLNLALEAVAGRKRHDISTINKLKTQLREKFCEILSAEGRSCEIGHSLIELFQMLSLYYSEKLDDLHKYLKKSVGQEYRTIFGNENCIGEQSDEYKSCVHVAIVAVEKLACKDVLQCDCRASNEDFRANWPAIWCFVKVVADIGELVLNRETNKNPDKKEEFIEKVVTLVKDLRDFLSYDHLLTSFEKLSKVMARLREVGPDGELEKFIREILESCDEGIVFIDELFSSITLYLHEKLNDVFSKMFRELPEINEDIKEASMCDAEHRAAELRDAEHQNDTHRVGPD